MEYPQRHACTLTYQLWLQPPDLLDLPTPTPISIQIPIQIQFKFKFSISLLDLCLQGSEVGPVFFDALAHVRLIHDSCRSLLSGTHQRAGLELMDQMAGYQETAYEKLCRCGVR